MSRGFASSYRIVLLVAGMLLCFAGLGARLVSLHVIDRGELLKYVAKARYQVIEEHARRGDILDAKGDILATSRTQRVLGVDPQVLRKEDESKWPELARLTGLKPRDLETILRTRTRAFAPAGMNELGGSTPEAPPLLFSWPTTATVTKPAPPAAVAGAVLPATAKAALPTAMADNEVVLEENESISGTGVRLIRWAKLSDHVDESTYDKIASLGIKGVYGTSVYRRAYPHNQLAAHLVGYVNKAGQAAAGVESYADFYLRGQDGWREGERDGRGKEAAQFLARQVRANAGFSVTLSVDTAVQAIVEEELDAVVKKYAPEKATIIVSDLEGERAGFILAMANYPTYNLNEYATAELATQRNLAVTDQYEPGSVFKIVAAAGALEEKLVTPETRFDVSMDRLEYKGSVRRLPAEDHNFNHPPSVAEIVAHSSNRGAAQLGMLMGDEKFHGYARAFGFGQRTGFPFGGEVRGQMAAPKDWDGLTITRMPMGHSIAATPLQMHMAMSTIANRGILLQPQVITEIRDSAGKVVSRFGKVEVRQVISPQTAETMSRLLVAVASRQGTAPEAAINYLNADFGVAGKTGTTQKLVPVPNGKGGTVLAYSTREHVVSFVGFFPASKPRVVISVIVDGADKRTPNGVAYGSKVAAPSFKRIGEQLIQYLDIKPPVAPGRNLLALQAPRP